MRIVFHIGFRRTGSTFLQKYIFPLHKNLNFIGLKNYNNWSDIKVSQEDFFNLKNKQINNLAFKFEDDKNNIISSEFFSSHVNYPNNFDEIKILEKTLKNKFNYIEIDFLVVLRNQYELIKSLYFHTYPNISKNLGVFEFKKLVNNFDENFHEIENQQIVKFIKSFDYLEIYSLIKKNFPDAKVKFLFFSDFSKKNKNFIEEFSEFLNVDLAYTTSLFNQGSKINQSKKNKGEILYTSRWRYFLSKYLLIKKIKSILPKSILNILSSVGVRKYDLSNDEEEMMKKKIMSFYKYKNKMFFEKTKLPFNYLNFF